MRSVSSLILELNSLPKGDIYKKSINGKEYFYHQYIEDGKRYSIIVKDNELESLKEKINRRKEIISILRDSNKDKDITLSKHAKELTGSVMCMEDEVARFVNSQLVYIDEDRCPLMIKRTHSLSNWLTSRVIDQSRVNARLLKKAFDIKENNDEIIPLYTYAVSVSDRYWFRPKQSKLKYKDVLLENDIYSEISLSGSLLIYPNKPRLSPELTTIGSYEKGWKLIDDEWWLYKVGSDKEIFSELLTYEISRMLLIPSAIYEYDAPYIRTKNFATRCNYEPLKAYLGDDSDYHYVFTKLRELGDLFAKEYLKLIFCDVLMNNVDRHNENIGLLRNIKTGKILSLAPNFDNNLSLVSRSELIIDPSLDGFMKYFLKEISKHKDMMDMYQTIDIPLLNEEIVQECIDRVPLKMDNESEIKKYILRRYNYLLIKLHLN